MHRRLGVGVSLKSFHMSEIVYSFLKAIHAGA